MAHAMDRSQSLMGQFGLKKSKSEKAFVDSSMILLGMKIANLNWLTYKNSAVDGIKMKEFEDKAIEKLNITEYKTWTYTVDKEQLINGGLATTGILSNITIDIKNPLPFVCFRGTYTLNDMKHDLKSMTVSNWYSSKGNLLGKAGKGFIKGYEALRDLHSMRESKSFYYPLDSPIIADKTEDSRRYISSYDRSLLQYALEEGKKYNGLIIAGHSLGGAMATLLAAEIMLDYGDEFPVDNLYIITFGTPRVFDIETSRKIYTNYKPKLFQRYVNSKDVITRLGKKLTIMKNKESQDVIRIKFVPLTHCSEALYYKGTDWYRITKSEEDRSIEIYDWVPRRSSLKQMYDYSYFFRSLAEPHRFYSKTGYLSTLKYSASYQEAIADLKNHKNKHLKESFKHLPLCTVPKEWDSDLFEICSAGASICLLSFLCPCILYGNNRQKFYNHSSSFLYGCSTLFCCPICSVYDRTQFRSDVRQRYDIVSNLDFAITLFFHNCAMIQEYNELQNDPSIDRRPVFRKEDWEIDLYGIITNPFVAGPDVFCLSCFCPCFQFGNIATKLEKDYDNCCLAYFISHIGCCCFIPAMEVRYELRVKHYLKGTVFSDFYRIFCCPSCTLIQMAVQLQHNTKNLQSTLKKQNTFKEYNEFFTEAERDDYELEDVVMDDDSIDGDELNINTSFDHLEEIFESNSVKTI